MTLERTGIIRRTLAISALVAVTAVLAAAPVRAQQLPSGEQLFITASVDNDRPYIGQQITYVTRIYVRSGFPHSVHYQPPTFAGFWDPGETEEYEPSEIIEARDYRVIERRTILFPGVVETLTIEPGVLTAPDPEESIVVESNTVTVDVRPLPTGAPAGFTGAVGRFEVSAEVDTATTRMNESVQLTVRVQGSGNIDALPDPSWPEFEGWRVIHSPAVTSSEVVDGQLAGSRTYESVLVPETPGDLSVPEISYAYFDPDREEYVQAATSPISVSVTGGDGETQLPPSSVGRVEDEAARTGAKSIRAVPPSLRKSGGEMTDSVVYWAMWCLPLLVIAGAAVWRRRRDAWEATLADSRRCNALPNAAAMLTRAVASGDDHAIASAEALSSYLSDRFGESLTGLTREALVERLVDAGVTTELAQQVDDTLALGEAARYTPEASSEEHKEDRTRRAAELMTELDGAVGI